MKTITTTILNSKHRTIYLGIFVVLAVMLLGAGIAVATGFTHPAVTQAQFDDGGDDGSYGGDDSYGDSSYGDNGGSFENYDGSGDAFGASNQNNYSNDSYSSGSDNSSVNDTPAIQDNDLSPCTYCTNTETPAVTTNDTPEVSDTPAIQDNDLSPCTYCNDTAPEVTTNDTPEVNDTPAAIQDNDLSPCTYCTDTSSAPTTYDTPEVSYTPAIQDNDLSPCTYCNDTETPAYSQPNYSYSSPSYVPQNSYIPSTYNYTPTYSAPVATPVYSQPTPVYVQPTQPIVVTQPKPVTPIVVTQPTPTPAPVIVTRGSGGTSGTIIQQAPAPIITQASGGSSSQIIQQVAVAAPVLVPQPVLTQTIPQTPATTVQLSQIPYTGLDLGPVGTIVYWVVLIAWCLAAAYLVIFVIVPFIYKRLMGFGKDVNHLLNNPSGLTPAAAGHGHDAPAPAAHHEPSAPSRYEAFVASQTQAPAAPAPTPTYKPSEGFGSLAAAGSALTIDDIVKGLSRQNDPAPVAPAQSAPASAHHELVPAEPTAHSNPVPQTSVPVASMPKPATQPSQTAPAAAPVSTDVRDFVGALLNGDRTTVFTTIRQMVREGGNAEDFITQVVCALDDAYRAPLDGSAVNPEIAKLTQNCAPAFLERLVAALTNAVDSSYSPGITGAKLAATRALAVVEG